LIFYCVFYELNVC